MLPDKMIEDELSVGPVSATTLQKTDDYSTILKAYGLVYKVTGHYLQVGEITPVQGWILHLSVVFSQVTDLLQTLLPVLVSDAIPFKIPINRATTEMLLGGMLGYINLAKIVSIYPNGNEQAIALAQKLIHLTAHFKGPDIPTDAHLESIVYTRYGSFNPILQANPYGGMDKYIYNSQMQLVPDSYYVPFMIPEGVDWPFNTIKEYRIPAQKKLLHGCIKPLDIIKNDVKGRVIKGVHLKHWWQARYCIVKEGKKNMCSDVHGRDIQDMLEWQYEFHNDLSTEVRIPKIIERFTENGDLYLAMEFINGDSLDSKIANIYDKNSWIDLPTSKRMQLLDYLLGVIDIIRQIHERGYIHRDLTSTNFIINKKNELYIIDLELMYNSKSDTPYPPFGPGTVGYASPEQSMYKRPTVKEDVYGLGALMIFFFTGLQSSQFELANTAILREDLTFFIPETTIADLIASCLQTDPQQRPELMFINDTLQNYRQQLTNSSSPHISPHVTAVSNATLEDVIGSAIRGIGSSLMTQEHGLWISKDSNTDRIVANQQAGYLVGPGLFEGISGALYMLARLKSCGIELDADIGKYYQLNFDYMRQNYFTAEQLPPSLCAGSAGIGLMLAAGFHSKLVAYSEENIFWLQGCLDRVPKEPDVLNGAAGQGLTLLDGWPYLPTEFSRPRLEALAAMLLEKQEKNGGWYFSNEMGRNIKITGLAQGSAGMVCFLLLAGRKLNSGTIQHAAAKALHWFQQQARKQGNTLIWPMDSKSKAVTPWLLHGSSGIALMFIKAYEYLGEESYKIMAETILNNYPMHISGRFLSYASGLAGVGEVYLEAWRVFNDDKWKARADWITDFLLHQKKIVNDNVCYWLTDFTDLYPTADLITGNSGIIHFLTRRLMPQVLPFPLFPSNSIFQQEN